MFRKKQFTRFLILLLPVLIITLACDLNVLEVSPFGQKPLVRPMETLDLSFRSMAYSGEGTTLWKWDKGKVTCETKDQMTLTVKGYDAVLVSAGICARPVIVNYEYTGACNEPTPGERCGNTIKGKVITEAPFTVQFSECTGGKTKGTAVGECNATECILTGEAICRYDIPDTITLQFKLTGSK